MMNFCPNCGEKITETAKFCPSCGANIASLTSEKVVISIQDKKDFGIEKKPVIETSRLAGLKIEKYLMPKELVIYSTDGSLYVGGEEGMKGYVTNNRVIFYSSKGLIFKSDRFHEIPLSSLNYYKIVEEGIILKKMHLQLNELKIKGDRSDVLGLYRTIQSAKQK